MIRMAVVATIVLVGFAGGLPAADAPKASAKAPRGPDKGQRVTNPEVWMCYRDPSGLFEEGADAEFVRRHVSGIKLYIGTVSKAPPDKLAKLVKDLKAHNIPLAVECGGTLGFAKLDDTNGVHSATIEQKAFNRIVAAGGKIDYLDLDGPVRRLLYPERGQGFESVDRCAAALMDCLRTHSKAYPGMKFWLLTNFPNWGYRGDVSYHARGPNKQDWGDYDTVVRTVLDHADKAKIPLAGVTVDNPYEYAMGEYRSARLPDPKKVDWIKRIRAYEDFARSKGLEFNFIANSEAGGKKSGKDFHERTLKMIDAYVAAGGKPTRYIIQSWYPNPTELVPETDEQTMTAVVKAAILKLHPELKAKAATKADGTQGTPLVRALIPRPRGPGAK
ncbi:MAG TPA: hypothetical protein VFJ30_08780 [Phycisphaerae bacterium]|nr:hypothetical protein [Phycisphaerae bacterium]